MFAGHMVFQTTPERVDQIAAAWREMTRQASHAKGLKSAHFMIRKEEGLCVVLGIWENRELANDFSQTSYFRTFIFDIMPLLIKPPERSVYEVVGFWN